MTTGSRGAEVSGVERQMARAADLMDAELLFATGLTQKERKVVTYWTLATHALPHVDTFPLLVLLGKMGTGKSQTLKIIKQFAHRARHFSLRGMTQPTIRDALALCQEGTASFDEADQAWKDPSAFEAMLSDRYQRDSAQASLKEAAGDREWVTKTKRYFGATVLHRRIPFNDAALDGRSVLVRFRADHSRKYAEYSEKSLFIRRGAELMRGFTFEPASVEQPPKVAARVFNTYKLLLSVAKMCGDLDFPVQIHNLLLMDSAELREAQSAEPDGLVVRAIVEWVSTNKDYRYIRVGTIVDSIFKNHKVIFQPRQVAALARQLRFETKNSHGVTVVVPTPATLLKACEECDYQDEAIAELRRQTFGQEAGGNG